MRIVGVFFSSLLMGNCWGVRIKAVSPSHSVPTSGTMIKFVSLAWIKMEA